MLGWISPVSALRKLRTPKEERHRSGYLCNWLTAGIESGPDAAGAPRKGYSHPSLVASNAFMEKVAPELRSVSIHSLVCLFHKYSLSVSCLSDTVTGSSDTVTCTFQR